MTARTKPTRRKTGTAVIDVPPALQRRAAELGITTIGPTEMAILRRSVGYADALNGLMWGRAASGHRVQRMITLPGGDTVPLITEAMESAAEVYRITYRNWQRLGGLPSRLVQSHVGSLEDHGRSTAAEASEKRQQHVARLWARSLQALAACKSPKLVRQCVDSVVIEDVAPALLLERPAALLALRAGLEALASLYRVADRATTPGKAIGTSTSKARKAAMIEHIRSTRKARRAAMVEYIRSARQAGQTLRAIEQGLHSRFGPDAPGKTWIFNHMKESV